MLIVFRVLINLHLLVNELCEYQNARCNDKNFSRFNCAKETFVIGMQIEV